MSCRDGENCRETQKRFRALMMLSLMLAIFIVLSVFSFIGPRDQALPEEFAMGEHQATAGKRVFQAYNCMGCHTIVGNGGYFGPDLTNIYEKAGPAWLAAFIPSAGSWPTETAVKVQLANPVIAADAGVSTLEAYYEKFPGARERIVRRGGQDTLMPNLTFSQDEVYRLIAFFEYTSAMDTEGWPPKVKVDGLAHRVRLAHDGRLPGTALLPDTAASAARATPVALEAGSAAQPAASGVDLVAKGEELAGSYGCTACHAASSARKVGPGWGGLFGSNVTLADGSTATVDEAYLVAAIRDPHAQVHQGFPKGVMPTYDESLISDADLQAIVAYLRSLEQP